MRIVFLITLLFGLACEGQHKPSTESLTLRTGAEVLISAPSVLEGKRLGLMINQSSRIGQTHLLDTLLSLGIEVNRLFAPEHGVRGRSEAGETVVGGKDSKTGIPIVSLYGAKKKPDAKDLQNLDLIIFDLQDVGARFFTYASSLAGLLESAHDQNIPVLVLDRPNPLGSKYLSGWTLQESQKSFVGTFPIPQAHGMTIGELATMMIGEHWIKAKSELLTVMKMENYSKKTLTTYFQSHWVAPSPNLPTYISSTIYVGTALFEGSNISEGRGTDYPFQLIGAPFLTFDMKYVADLGRLYGINVKDTVFTPRSMPGKAGSPKWLQESCTGIYLIPNLGATSFDPAAFGFELFRHLQQNNPEMKISPFLYKLVGVKSSLDHFLTSNLSAPSFWKKDIQAFKGKRSKYSLYEY